MQGMRGIYIMKLIIRANEKYAKRLYKHLIKEHPSTKQRMTLKK